MRGSIVASALLGLALLSAPPAAGIPEDCPEAPKDLGWSQLNQSIVVPTQLSDRLSGFLCKQEYKGWCHDVFPRTNDVRLTGPFIQGKGYTTHARVRVYYSRAVVDWLEDGRVGVIPDGAMIVKEMHPLPDVVPPGESPIPTGWAVMIRDAKASKDGWVWFLFYLPNNQTSGVEFRTAQVGQSFCTSCHGSTDVDQGTFSFLGNLENEDVATYVADREIVVPGTKPNPRSLCGETQEPNDLKPLTVTDPPAGEPGHGSHASYAVASNPIGGLLLKPVLPPRKSADPALLEMLETAVGGSLPQPDGNKLKNLPLDLFYDHIVQPPDAPRLFTTGDSCSGCHDASNLLNEIQPHMTTPLEVEPEDREYDVANYSPYGEWTGSMMHLSSRDPIFRAQFEWELASLQDPVERNETAQLCMSCHAVMGEREAPALALDPASYYAYPSFDLLRHTPEQIREGTFGALARDGVSCTVCHHVAAKGLGTESTYTAKFLTGPPDEIYGPYEDVQKHPMQRVLGVTPMQAPQIQESALCGSCHTVQVPVFGEPAPRHVFEQTTYLEWVNSDFGRSVADPSYQTCQDCHMPATNPVTGKPIETRIANLEDTTFPYVPNRANSGELGTKPRKPYRRHTLLGINVFGMAMFDQFPLQLGSSTFSPNRARDVLPAGLLALWEAVEQAQERTVEAVIERVDATPQSIDVRVRVTNLAGHKLPSGVGFRRAWLEVSTRDASGNTIWCSGCTNAQGVIVDTDGNPLRSEFAKTPGELQIDLALIQGEGQVQIYETRHIDSGGQLTTSFVRLSKEVKDNRLLPRGWSASDPTAPITKPVGLAGPPTPGTDTVLYQIPTWVHAKAVSVRVRLLYQSIPPYYLADRFGLLAGATDGGASHPETQRLLYMALHLNNSDPRSASSDWKLALACSEQSIGGGPPVGCMPERIRLGADPAKTRPTTARPGGSP